MMQPQSRGNGCQWPWPYFKLSNGIELEVHETIDVRCLKAVSPDHGRGIYKANVGQIVRLRAETRNITLVKPGRGDRNFLMLNPAPIEGVDFELIPGRGISLTNSDARELVDKWMGPTLTAARNAREFDKHTYIPAPIDRSFNLMAELDDLFG